MRFFDPFAVVIFDVEDVTAMIAGDAIAIAPVSAQINSRSVPPQL
jgi:hypothetical protein